MQTYKYEELDERAQDAAIERYGEDQAVEEAVAEAVQEFGDRDFSDIQVFNSLGWRFNEHGERVA